MKKLKKLISILLSLSMLSAISSISAFAATTDNYQTSKIDFPLLEKLETMLDDDIISN